MTIGKFEVKIKNKKAGMSTEALPIHGEIMNKIRETSCLSAASRNENSSFVSMTTGRQRALRRWNSSHPFVFLHIAKNGGTSFDVTIGPIVKYLGGQYIGHVHFDWSYIETLKHPDVAVLLRDPVARAVSHFHFAKKKTIKRQPFLNVSLGDFIRDPQKNVGATSYLAGWSGSCYVADWHALP